MTPAKTTASTRAEAARRRRADVSRARKDDARQHVRYAATAPTLSRTRAVRPVKAPTRSKVRRRYQVAVPFGGNAVLSLPSLHVQAGPRAISAAIAVAMLGLLAILWAVPPFVVQGAQVVGGQRLGASDITSVLGMTGKPIVTADTAQLEERLRDAFPEIRDVAVRVGFPTGLVVTLTERTPIVAWQQADKTLWLDSEGVAFPPRGTADGLIMVQASGEPPALDASNSINTSVTAPQQEPPTAADPQRLLTADAVSALQAIAPYVPPGSALIYDRAYGLGWTDARGWQAYFGQTTSDLSLKLSMYQTLVDNLASRGIQPTLISVEYPDAPFYRAAQQDQEQ
jgi:cell division protein FtsQ